MWINPVPYTLVPTDDSMSFLNMPSMHTGLPTGNHVGAFGVKRKHHWHEGVDLYVPKATPIITVEEGEVVAVVPFTGPAAGLPWWLDTQAVFVEGPSGVVVYGEIAPHIAVGTRVVAGTLIGVAIPVLKHDKGRPMCMLHLELHTPGSRSAPEWLTEEKPEVLIDPTSLLLNAQCLTKL